MELVAKTLYGLEEVLAKELKDLGAHEIKTFNRAVNFRGDKAIMYKANLHLRTALSILVPIKRFKAPNEDALYNSIRSIDWAQFFGVDQTFAIYSSVSGNVFTHSQYVALKVKDAIVDQFREKFDERPSIDTDNPDVKLNLHIYNDKVTLSLDSSGDNLGRRGYRLSNTGAPLNEVLAAGIILLSQWDKETEFIDGMCGSGTFAIEASLMATNTPPGLNRRMGFETWQNFDENLWDQLKQEAKDQICPTSTTIRASDIANRAMKTTTINARRAGMEKWIEVDQQNFKYTKPKTGMAHVVLNPPYGERLQLRDLLKLYQTIGSSLKHNYPGSKAFVLSANQEATHQVGLKPFFKHKLYNGKLECKLNGYQLFEGSHKEFKTKKRRRKRIGE